MQIYTGTLRIRGSILNEVPLTEVSAAEVYVLRHLHGDDAVVGLAKRRMDKRPHKDEFERLSDKYSAGSRNPVADLFGQTIKSGGKLPVSVDGDDEPEAPAPASGKASKASAE